MMSPTETPQPLPPCPGAVRSGLAQVEEPQHAGAPEAELTVSNAILNRKHWAAIGQLGAAHLVADSPSISASSVRDKYFIPYLVAFFQPLVSNRLVDEVGRILSEPRDAERALDTSYAEESKKTAHGTGGPEDYWIVGSWSAFAALCVALRMSGPRHGDH